MTSTHSRVDYRSATTASKRGRCGSSAPIPTPPPAISTPERTKTARAATSSAASLAPDDTEFAARLAPLWWRAANDWQIDGHRFSPAGVIPYDPKWADEIDASIQQYLDTR